MFRMGLQYVTWWWHLRFRVECVTLSTAKFDWSEKIQSMPEVEVGIR